MNNKATKGHPFDADELLAALKDIRDRVRGTRKITMRTTAVPLPSAPLSVRPRQVRNIRVRLHVSQEVFARLLNVPVVTAKSWETGRRRPSGAAVRLLQVADRRPETLLGALTTGQDA